MSNLKFLGAKIYDTQIFMHTRTLTSDVSLTLETPKHLSNTAHKHGLIAQRKYKKIQVNKIGHKGNFMFRRMLMLCRKMLRCFLI